MSQFPPVAAPRRTRLLTPKDELVKSFDGFSGSTLEPRHIEYANHCIASGATTSSRYQYIKFDELLERNQVRIGSRLTSILRENVEGGSLHWSGNLQIKHALNKED